MVVLCFVVDVSLLSSTSLKAVKNSLLQFGNLYAVRKSRKNCADISNNGIGLCFVKFSDVSGNYELQVVQTPERGFNLRDFHHAVRNLPSSTLDRAKLDGSGYCKQVSCLSALIEGKDGLLYCAAQDIVKKIVVISSCFMESVAALTPTLLEAADHLVAIEFLEVEQDNCGERIEKCGLDDELVATHQFAEQVSEFENCTLHRVLSDPWTFMRLMKRWLLDMSSDGEASVDSVLLFPRALAEGTNKVFCSFQPATMELEDVFRPCKICRCHGETTETSGRALPESKVSLCPVTGQKLGPNELSDNGIMIGSETVLSMPSFKSMLLTKSSRSAQGTTMIAFDIIKCISLATLSEGLLFGTPYIVCPSDEMDIDVTVSTDAKNIDINEQIFTALLQDLHSRDCGLLCTSTTDIETRIETSLLCFYVLLPGQSGSFLAKEWQRLAGAEEVMVTTNPASGFNDSRVPAQIKSFVSKCLSELGLETYNPLEHIRGCHSKLTSLVRESLKIRSTIGTEIARFRPQTNWHQLRDQELLTSEDRRLKRKSNLQSECSFISASKMLMGTQTGTRELKFPAYVPPGKDGGLDPYSFEEGPEEGGTRPTNLQLPPLKRNFKTTPRRRFNA